MAREFDLESEFFEQVVHINRVTKVVKGGKNFSFAALVVIGDGKAAWATVQARPRKCRWRSARASRSPRRTSIEVPIKGTTIPHETVGTFGAGRVLLKPASPGTGVIAGGPVRAVIESAGIQDILTKSLGSTNPHNVVKATMAALLQLRDEATVRKLRAVPVEG